MTAISRRRLLSSSAAAAAGAALTTSSVTAASATSALTGLDGASAAPLQLARVWGEVDGLDTTHRMFDDGSLEVILWPGDADRLAAAGVRVEVLEQDLAMRDALDRQASAGRAAGLAVQPGEVDDYRTIAQHEQDLRDLAAAHPNTAKLIELPFITFEGRTVLGLEIGRDVHMDADGRPTFHVDGIHHAREWPAGELAIMFAFDLLENDGSDPRITQLMDRVRFTVVPVVNPDGYDHSRSAPAETPGGTAEAITLGGRQAYWRKNRRSFTDDYAGDGLVSGGHSRYPAQVRGTDAYGVDPNRNYAYTWGRAGSSSTDVHSQSHRGEAPFSEPESRNIAWLMTTRHITGALSHHTGTVEIIWPWANEMGEAPDEVTYQAIGDAMGAINGYNARKYNTSEGTTPDHFYGSTATLCFLFENTSSFHPDYTSTIPALYATNRDAFLLMAEELALEPALRAEAPTVDGRLRQADGSRTRHHAVLTGRVVDADGNGVQATLTTRKRYQSPLWLFGNGDTPKGRTEHEEVFEASITTAADGSFTWLVNPSTRPHVQAQGGTEAYELAVSTGTAGTVRHVTVARGDVLDLGDLPVV